MQRLGSAQPVGSTRRPRYDGSPETLAEALDPRNVGDIMYHEEPEAKTDTKLLHNQADRLRRVSELMPSMVFKPKDVEAACKHIMQLHGKEWKLSASQRDDYIALVSKRLLNMFGHCAQALRRKENKPAWAITIFGNKDGSEQGAAGRGDDLDYVGNLDDVWVVGFDAEHKQVRSI